MRDPSYDNHYPNYEKPPRPDLVIPYTGNLRDEPRLFDQLHFRCSRYNAQKRIFDMVYWYAGDCNAPSTQEALYRLSEGKGFDEFGQLLPGNSLPRLGIGSQVMPFTGLYDCTGEMIYAGDVLYSIVLENVQVPTLIDENMIVVKSVPCGYSIAGIGQYNSYTITDLLSFTSKHSTLGLFVVGNILEHVHIWMKRAVQKIKSFYELEKCNIKFSDIPMNPWLPYLPIGFYVQNTMGGKSIEEGIPTKVIDPRLTEPLYEGNVSQDMFPLTVADHDRIKNDPHYDPSEHIELIIDQLITQNYKAINVNVSVAPRTVRRYYVTKML